VRYRLFSPRILKKKNNEFVNDRAKSIQHYSNLSVRNWILVVLMNKVPQFGFEKKKKLAMTGHFTDG